MVNRIRVHPRDPRNPRSMSFCPFLYFERGRIENNIIQENGNLIQDKQDRQGVSAVIEASKDVW